jgi:hypothetical protein
MQAWLRHWRRWLLFGCCLVVLGSVGALLYELLRPDPVRLAFSRVQLGMTENEVLAVVNQIGAPRIEPAEGEILIMDDQYPIVDAAIPKLSIPRLAQDTWARYGVGTGQIVVVFRNELAVHKISLRYPTVLDRLRVFLTRIRAAVGL